MSKHCQKYIYHLSGYMLGWQDSHQPYRYLKLAATDGEQLVKITKSLRSQVQDWRPGIYLNLLVTARLNRSTGQTKIKVKQLLNLTSINTLPIEPVSNLIPANSAVNLLIDPTTIRVCQGSSCRKRGSEKICRSIQIYLDQNNLTKNVNIEPVKCLHQCRSAPHAIIHHPKSILPAKTHYRQLQSIQVPAMLAKHLPIVATSPSLGVDLIEKIGNYLHRQSTSASNFLS